MSLTIEEVKTASFTMKYFKFGTGSKVFVILPGISVQSVMGSADAVANQYAKLTDDYTVYLFDRREDLPSSYTVRDMADDTAEAFRALGLKNIVLFGASQGGMIAMTIAINEPDLISRLILGSTSSRITDEQFDSLKVWIDLANANDGVALYQEFAKALYPDSFIEKFKDAFILMGNSVKPHEFARFVTIAEGTKDFNVTSKLKNIECPTLVLGAADDKVLGVESTNKIISELETKPGFESFIYDGYGHAAFDTAPDYLDRIISFLKR